MRDPTRPWEYRQPHLPPPSPCGTPQYLQMIETAVDDCPTAWLDGCAALAREWMAVLGLDATNPEVLRAYLLGVGLSNPSLDLVMGLYARLTRLDV